MKATVSVLVLTSTLLAVTLICFLISSGAQETRHQIDYGKNQRTLQVQRDLADKAETSRYIELQKQLETMNQSLATRLRDIETRIDDRVTRVQTVPVATTYDPDATRPHVKL